MGKGDTPRPVDKARYDRNYLYIFGSECPRCGGDGAWHSLVGWAQINPVVKCPYCNGIGYIEKEEK